MAKWDFKIVGASFVKELVPVGDDVQPRSQSFMQPSFHLEGGKIVMKESGAYVTSIYFSLIGEIDGVAPTDIEDAYAKLLVLVENFNGGGGAPGTTPSYPQTLAVSDRLYKPISALTYDFIPTDAQSWLSFLDATEDLEATITDEVGFLSNCQIPFVVACNTLNLISGTGVTLIDLQANPFVEIPNIVLQRGDIGLLVKLVDDLFVITVTNKSSGGGTWGSITGTLSTQTDLQTALDAKQDDLTAANMYTYVDSLTSLATPVDADRMIIVDNSASLAKKITWANIKSTLKTYFDGFYSSKQPGSFSGTFALDALGGNFYNDLTQVGALTFAAGGSAIVGGSDCVKITANGSAITIPGTFINVGGESISIVNGAINRITVMKTASEIWYTVKVN